MKGIALMTKYRSWLRIGLLVAGVCATPALRWAQAAISGVVTDESGGALPGVTVEAASPALIEKVRTVYTDTQGLYPLVDLRPGVYTVTFTLPGFATLVRDQITLEGTGTATINGQLKVGAIEETLTVTGEAPLVDTSSAVREQVVNRELLDALPTGRQMWTVAVTLPGVSLNGQDVCGPGGLQQTRMRAFGAVEQEVTIEVDGILMNSVHGGGSTQQYFNDGMVQEMSVQTGALGAETPDRRRAPEHDSADGWQRVPRLGRRRFGAELQLPEQQPRRRAAQRDVRSDPGSLRAHLG